MHLTSVYVTKIPLCEGRLDLNHFVFVGLSRGFATSLGFSSNYAFLKLTVIKDNPWSRLGGVQCNSNTEEIEAGGDALKVDLS